MFSVLSRLVSLFLHISHSNIPPPTAIGSDYDQERPQLDVYFVVNIQLDRPMYYTGLRLGDGYDSLILGGCRSFKRSSYGPASFFVYYILQLLLVVIMQAALIGANL